MKVSFVYDRTLSGHSNAVQRYAAALEAEDVEAVLIPLEPQEWADKPLDRIGETDLLVQCFIPPLMHPLEGECLKNVAIVFHEWDRLPAPWALSLSRFDEVWVPSEYLEEVLVSSGFNGRVEYIPIPMSSGEIPHKTSWEAGKPFRFLSVGEWHFRKGFHLLFEAFRRAFPSPGKAELWIKTSPIVDYDPGIPHIKLLIGEMPYGELLSGFREYDAYVTASLAEGFGLPVLEAMEAGLPVLAPTWSGLTELCGPGRSFELPFTVVPQPFCSRPDYYAPGQRCALIDIGACAQVLREVASMPPDARGDIAKGALAHISRHLSPSVVGKKLHDRLTSLVTSKT